MGERVEKSCHNLMGEKDKLLKQHDLDQGHTASWRRSIRSTASWKCKQGEVRSQDQ